MSFGRSIHKNLSIGCIANMRASNSFKSMIGAYLKGHLMGRALDHFARDLFSYGFSRVSQFETNLKLGPMDDIVDPFDCYPYRETRSHAGLLVMVPWLLT